MVTVNARWCALVALLVWGCGAREQGAGAEQEAANAQIEADSAPEAPAGSVLEWPARKAVTDSIPVYRWTEAEGSRVVGYLPGDANAGAVVGPHGIFIWRPNDAAGDYEYSEPWLLRPDRGGLSLGKPDIYVNTAPQWLPGRPLLVFNHNDLILVDTAGRTVRRMHPEATTPTWVHDIAVNPADGRIAAMLARRPRPVDGSPQFDLVILDPELRQLAKIEAVSLAGVEEGVAYSSLSPHWLPDGRIAFIRFPIDPDSAEVRSTPPRLAFADLTRGSVDVTAIEIEGIDRVTPEGYLGLVYRSSDPPEGCRYFDPRRNACTTVPLPETLGWNQRFSPDGRWIAATRFGEADGIGVLRRSDNSWLPLGKGELLGWDETNALYWADAGKP